MRLLGGIAERVVAAIVAELPIEKKRFFEISKRRDPSPEQDFERNEGSIMQYFLTAFPFFAGGVR